MTDDLLTEARHLAERGWLPGIKARGELLECSVPDPRLAIWVAANDADLHLAAHDEIVRRGWSYEIRSDGWTSVQIPINDDEIPWENYKAHSQPGTDTLALLRCLLGACEAAEEEST